MAEVFRPADGKLDIAGHLPPEFGRSANLAQGVIDSLEGNFVIDRMSWRPKMDNAVIYLLLNDPRPIFADLVAGLAVLRPNDATGKIRLGFTREPATDALQNTWDAQPPIVRKRAWPNPILDLEDADASAGVRALNAYRQLLRKYADEGTLKRSGTSRPELRMRLALQRMFPEAGFSKSRPAWLLGTRGKALELDIYSEALKIAVEVQGPYHEKPIAGEDALARQQARDALKRKLCADRGVNLLIADASALDLEVFTLPPDTQKNRIEELLSRTAERGVYEWPERAGGSDNRS